MLNSTVENGAEDHAHAQHFKFTIIHNNESLDENFRNLDIVKRFPLLYAGCIVSVNQYK